MKRAFIIVISLIVSVILYATDVLTYVYTPKNHIVPDTYTRSGYSNPVYNNEQMQYIQERLYVLYDGATIEGDADYRYNCHAYAWHLSENPNAQPVWIGLNTTTAEDAYWNDSSYVCVPEDISTKVSYNASGNHSAIRINSSWYKSKWGSFFLIKHNPNAVPNGIANELVGTTNYHPELAKTYYRSQDFIGDKIPCGQSVYYVDNLTNGYSVEWSFMNSTTPSIINLLSPNYPSTGQCTINNANSVYVKDTLLAVVKKYGNHVVTLKKEIDTGANFVASYTGTYIAQLLQGEPIPQDIPSTLIYSGNKLSVRKGYRITMSSTFFQNATVNYTGNNIYDWSNDGQGTISFTLRSMQPSGINKIYGHSGCNVFEIKVLVINNGTIIDPILILSPQGRMYEITLGNIDCDSDSMSYLSEKGWDISVYDAMSNYIVLKKHVTGLSYKMDTTGWKAGIYIIKAQVFDKTLTEKIVIQ